MKLHRYIIEIIKKVIKNTSSKYASTKLGKFVNDTIITDAMNHISDVVYKGEKIRFSTPNTLTHWRAESFSIVEPETLEWIEQMPEGSVLWDVGANVGLFSVYAAKTCKGKVIAFEPSVFNLELLARNLFLNDIQKLVTIIPLALNDHLGSNLMRMTTTEWGGALSSFGKDFGWDGKTIQGVFEFNTFGLTMDQAVSHLNLPTPDFIKLDVDGIEHLVLEGGKRTLRGIESILIEINDDFVQQAENSKRLLKNAGLELKYKKQSKLAEHTKFKHTFNQIWERA
jgi:FkbM family methyltransferase